MTKQDKKEIEIIVREVLQEMVVPLIREIREILKSDKK